MINILKKELKSILNSPLSYIVLAIFIGLLNFLFLKSFFIGKVLTLRYYFDLLIWFLVIFIPALSMKVMAEEFRSGTIEFLITKPISNVSIIGGKFLSLISYFLLFISSTIILSISLAGLGNIDSGILVSQILGLIFLSVGMFAISFFASSITTNQVFAFLIAVFINFIFVLIGIDFIQMSFPYAISNVLMQLSFLSHFEGFLKGTVNLSDIFYFISIITISLYLSYLSLCRYQKNQKLGISIFKGAEIGLIFGIFIFVNLVVGKLNIYADLTENKVYTISEASKEILGSSNDIIDINLYVSADLPPQLKIKYQQIKDLIVQFKSFSNNNLVIREIHPVQDEKENEAIEDGVSPIQIQVLDNDQYAVKKGYFGVVIKHLGKKEVIGYLGETNNYEHILISKILKLTNKERKEIFLITSEDITKEMSQNLVQLISQDYQVNVQKVENSSGGSLFYEDNKIWLIIKGDEDFPNYVYESIENNIDSDKTMIVFWQPYLVDLSKSMGAEKKTGKMEEILRDKFNTEISQGIIGDTRYNSPINFRQGFVSYTLPYPYFIKSLTDPEIPVSQGVEAVSLPFSPALISEAGNYKIENILKTSENAFEDSDISDLSPNKRLNINNGDLKEFTVGKTYIKGDFSFTAIPSIHLFDMVSGADLRNNVLFASNLIDWLGGDKRLIEIRSKNTNFSIFDANLDQKNIIKSINIYIIPILLVLFGIGINLFAGSKRKN